MNAITNRQINHLPEEQQLFPSSLQVLARARCRRGKLRFPLSLEVRYKALSMGTRNLETGTGTTLNLSSGAVWFSAQSWLPVGTPVELSITWPVMLHESCPIKLAVSGSVIRSNSWSAVVTVERYEYRTQSTRATEPVRMRSVSPGVQR